MKKKNWKVIIPYILIPLCFIAITYSYINKGVDTKKSQYYEVVEYFDEGKVTEYQLTLSSGALTYKLKGDDKVYKYTVPNVNLFLEDIHDSVHNYNKAHPDAPIKMDYAPGASNSWLFSILPTVLIMLALGLFTYLMIKKTNNAITSENNRAINFGKARVRHGNDTDKVTFDDVAGADEEKEELQEIVEFLKDPAGFNKLGARIPKGVLLVGPPGTGKTLLAKAVAGEADAPFLSISGSDFVEMYVGVGASRVRDLFQEAKKSSPSIIFIDEIDAVGRHRGAGMGGGHDEREQTLNQLLVEMDGFAVNSGIIVIAATNRPDILDPALLRPGRFDRRVTVGYPDVKGREEILKVHSRKKPLGPDVDLHVIAATTAGFTGADLENLLNEAALLAAKRKLMAITMKEIQEATVKVVVGSEKKSHRMTDKEKRMTAYHEAGHAVSSYYLESQDPVQEVSIIPRGGAGGYTLYVPMEDKSYKYKKEMFEDIVSLLGGRVAEKIINDGDVSTGASNDIQRASEIARNMITKYGMSDKLGPITFGSGNDEVFLGKDYNHIRNYSEKVAAQIDEEVEAIMSQAYEQTQSILNAHFDKLSAVAENLITLEKITGEQFKSIMETGALPAEESKKETVTDGTDSENNTNTEEHLSSEETGSDESATDFQESEDKKEE